MHRGRIVAVAALAAGVAGASVAAVAVAAGSAGSGGCGQTVRISGPNAGILVLSPDPAKVAVGDCLAFTNATGGTVDLTISSPAGKTVYTAEVGKGATTSTAASYAPKVTGSETIAATEHILLLKVKGSGKVTVTPAPKPTKTSSSRSSGSPGGGKQHSTHPTHKSTAPHKSRSPKPHRSGHNASPSPHATGFKLPPLPPLPTGGVSVSPLPKGSAPLVAPGQKTTAPRLATDSATPVAAVVGGPLETAENNHRGLPIAVAVLVVLGLATGFGRVLLAGPGPVDDRPGGEHRA